MINGVVRAIYWLRAVAPKSSLVRTGVDGESGAKKRCKQRKKKGELQPVNKVRSFVKTRRVRPTGRIHGDVNHHPPDWKQEEKETTWHKSRRQQAILLRTDTSIAIHMGRQHHRRWLRRGDLGGKRLFYYRAIRFKIAACFIGIMYELAFYVYCTYLFLAELNQSCNILDHVRMFHSFCGIIGPINCDSFPHSRSSVTPFAHARAKCEWM